MSRASRKRRRNSAPSDARVETGPVRAEAVETQAGGVVGAGTVRLLVGCAFLAYLDWLLDSLRVYDWQALPKFGLLASLVASIGLLVAGRGKPRTTQWVPDAVIFALITLYGLRASELHFENILESGRRVIDIGRTTEEAARLFFVEHVNPYAPPEGVATRGYTGFYYGPLMFLGYPLAAFVRAGVGVKLTNAVWLAAAVGYAMAIATRGVTGRAERVARCALLAAILFVNPFLSTELFRQGVTDVWPVLLLLVALDFAYRERKGWMWLFVALSFTAKPVPACFFALALLRRDLPWKQLAKVVPLLVVLGLLLAVTFRKELQMIVLAHGVRAPDRTSLFSLVPASAWVPLTVAHVAAMTLPAAAYFFRKTTGDSVLDCYLLSTMGGIMFHRAVHLNYLIWVLPFLAIMLAARYGRLGLGISRSPAAVGVAP